MGQEYSQGGLNSVSYPEAIGYIERNRLKGKNKYNLKKVEIKSFSRIPYSKYIPLSERETKTYKQSLKPSTATSQKPPPNNDRKPGGRIVNISPPGKRKYAQNVVQKSKNPVSNYKDKSSSSKANHNVSISSNNSQALNTSNASSKKSANGSLVSLKDKRTKTPGSASSTRSRFVPRNEKEAQLQKIYVKADDLVLEMPKQKTKKSPKKTKSENGDIKSSKKKKALFKIRKKMKIDPSPVYLESPFKRQTTIRIKKNQIVPAITKEKSKDDLNDSKSTTDSRPSTSKTLVKRPNSSVSFSNQRPGSGATSVQLSVVGTKASLFNKDSNEGFQIDHTEEEIESRDELTKLFEKRTQFPPKKPVQNKPLRPQTASEADAKLQKSKNKIRPQSRPYTSMAYIGGQIVYPGYKGKTLITKNNVPPKRKSKSAIQPLSNKQPGRRSVIKGKVGDFNIVKGKKKNKSEPKGASGEPKVRLKWFNVLHRTHYQNRIGSLYNKDDLEENDFTKDDYLETGRVNDNRADSDMNSARSLNTYSDSCLTNTTVSTANATVVGELDRNVAEVEYEPTENSQADYEPSLTSEFSVFSTRQTRVSGPIDYEGDGETDLDRPLKFKDKKSPDILRKDLLKMQEIHFKNHPGLEEETDSSDSGTLTGNFYPAVGHVQKMRELFGAIEYNKNHPHTRPPRSRTKDNDIQEYKPSFMNETMPSHLFMAKKQPDEPSKNEPKIVAGTNNTNQKATKIKDSNKSVKTVANDSKLKPVKRPVAKNNNEKIKNTFITQNFKAKTVKTPDFLKEKPVKPNANTSKKTPQQNSKQQNKSAVPQQKKKKEEQTNDNEINNNFTPARQIIVSPFNSDDDDSLAELEDAATLATKLLSSNKAANVSSELNDVTESRNGGPLLVGEAVNGHNKTTKPQNITSGRKVEDQEEEDELDKVLKEIQEERQRREQKEHELNLVNKQQNGPFKMETASKTLNPVITYKKDVHNNNPLHQTYDLEKPRDDPHDDVRRSIHFQSARAMFEQNKAMFDQNNDDLDDSNKDKFVLYENGHNEDDPNVLSSDQTVTIEGNYDDYARRKRTTANKTPDKGGLFLPRIVNKDTYALYSRHGPVQSKGVPIARNKALVQDKDKSISAMAESYKGTRYNGYSWKSSTADGTNNNQGRSLYSTLVQNRYQNANNGAIHPSNKSTPIKSVNGPPGAVNKRTAEVTKL